MRPFSTRRSMPSKGLADRSPGLRIAVAVDKVDWHAREIARAMSSLGARAIPFRLSAARFDTDAAFGLNIRGFGNDLPDAVIVRAISGGTFQAVTMRLGILHALRELGVPVWNDARAIERCVDKSTTTFLLDRAGIPTPATWTVESMAAARGIAQRETQHGPLVLKPLFGSQGRGLQLIRAAEDLPSPETTAGVYYLQRFRRGRTRRLSRPAHPGAERPGRRGDGPPCGHLDHQHQSGRPPGGDGPGRAGEDAGGGGRRSGRRRIRRRRHRARRGRASLRPGGQQHAGMARSAAGDLLRISPG